jgi:phospholipase C
MARTSRLRDSLRRPWVIAVIAIALAVVVIVPIIVYSGILAPETPGRPGSESLGPFATHIDHIVFVVLENHAFDNYFGTYCPQTGPDCPSANLGIPPGTCVPVNLSAPSEGCIRPFNFTPSNWSLTSPLPHSQESSLKAFNGGAMNGFYSAEDSGLDPFGHYNGSTAPIYWDLAESYSLDDNFFSSIMSYSLPNHWHIVAGQAPQQIIANSTLPPGKIGLAGSHVTVFGEHKYLDQANRTKSVEDLLFNSSVSWKYYDNALGSYNSAISLTVDAQGNVTKAGPAFNYWNPLAAKAESYDPYFSQHYVPNTQFYADAANGSLPQISWVIPAGQDSDHPPENSTTAQGWIASLVDAVSSSPDWNSTAMFITWDDYGGFFDNVPPPTFAGQQLGFRVPLLVISPYARAGYITSSFGYFESILHLIELRFNLGCITALDCNAPVPLDMFDFSGPPRPPHMFPTSVSQATYPIPPSNASYGAPRGPYTPPISFTYFPSGEAPDVD